LKEEKIEQQNANKWSWYQFVYVLAQGDICKMETIFKTNFILTLNHKAFELENKKVKEYYDFRRFNITANIQ
jgi:hypothetical protein